MLSTNVSEVARGCISAFKGNIVVQLVMSCRILKTRHHLGASVWEDGLDWCGMSDMFHQTFNVSMSTNKDFDQFVMILLNAN